MKKGPGKIEEACERIRTGKSRRQSEAIKDSAAHRRERASGQLMSTSKGKSSTPRKTPAKRRYVKFEEVMGFMVKSLREMGIDVTDSMIEAAEKKIRQEWAGETYYIKGPTREMRAAELAELGPMKLRDLAAATGLSVRTIKRIRNGK